MRKRNGKSLLFEKLLFVAIFLAQIQAFCIKVVPVASYLSRIEVVSFLLLAIIVIKTLFCTKMQAKELVISVLLLILGIVSYIVTDSLTLPYLILLTFASKGVKFEKIVKADLISKVLTTLFIIMCYFAHLTNGQVFYRNGAVREAYGFVYPNTLGYVCVVISLEMLYLLKNKTNSILVRILAMGIPLVLSVLSGSKTAQIAIVVSLLYSILCLVYKKHTKTPKRKNLRNPLRYYVYLVPFVMIALSFASAHAYSAGADWAIKMDEAMSGRVYWQDYYSDHEKITLLGKDIGVNLKKAPLDNGYYRVLFNNGLLGLFSLLIIVELALSKSMKMKNSITPVLLMLLFYGLSEWVVFRVIVTPLWSVAFAETEEKNAKEDD